MQVSTRLQGRSTIAANDGITMLQVQSSDAVSWTHDAAKPAAADASLTTLLQQASSLETVAHAEATPASTKQ